MFGLEYKLIAAAAAFFTLVGIALWIPTHYREQGRNEIRALWKSAADKQAIINRAKELVDAQNAQAKYDEYIKTKADLAIANTNLSDANVRLHTAITSYKRRLSEAAKSPSRTVDTGAIGGDLLEECASHYTDMAKEAGRLSDKVNGLIDQVQR